MEDLLHRRYAVMALIFLCGLLAFHNSFENSFHFDDEHSILQNPHIRLQNIPAFFVDPGKFSGMSEARMYRPLLLVTYALNYAANEALGLDGYQVQGYHLINFLLHLLNAWLVWGLGCRLLRERESALLAALVFALHPLMSEPVNYISSRSSLLAVLFYLLAFRFLVRAAEGAASKKTILWIVLLYLAALSSKSIAITWPLLGAAYLVLLAERRPWRLVLLPAFLSLPYLLLTRTIVGKALLEPVRSHAVQWATQLKALAYYLWKAVMPVHLSVEPQFRAAQGFFDAHVIAAGLLGLSIAVVGMRGWRQNRLLAFGAAWFFLSLLPASLVPLNILVNEHRLYLPMVGGAVGVAALVDRYNRRRWIWILILLVFAVQSVQRNKVWKSEETLWADAVARGPSMARPYANLGKAYLEQGRFQEAIDSSRQAIQINPRLARAYYNIGTAHLHRNDHELAVAHYRRALEIQPDLFEAQNNLGNTFQELGRLEEAIQAYKKALDIMIQAPVYHNLGKAFLGQGRTDSAVVAFRQGFSLDPDQQESYKGLVKACRAEEQLETALAVLREALQRWPEDATFWSMTGDAYAALGQDHQAARAYKKGGKDERAIQLSLGHEARRRHDWKKAREHYEHALQAGGEDARVYNALGETWYGQERIPEALQAFRKAARLDPKMAIAYANIGRANLQRRGHLEAIAALERAVELESEDGGMWALLAEAYSQSLKPELAIDAYREAIKWAPGKAAFYHNLGLLYQRAGHGAAAENMYRSALEREPELAGAWYNLGNLHLDREQLAAAVAAYQKALELEPDHAHAHVNLAMAWLYLDREDEAIAVYERFLEVYGEEDELKFQVRGQLEALRQESGSSAP